MSGDASYLYIKRCNGWGSWVGRGLPYPGEPLPHEGLSELRPGTYLIGAR